MFKILAINLIFNIINKNENCSVYSICTLKIDLPNLPGICPSLVMISTKRSLKYLWTFSREKLARHNARILPIGTYYYISTLKTILVFFLSRQKFTVIFVFHFITLRVKHAYLYMYLPHGISARSSRQHLSTRVKR